MSEHSAIMRTRTMLLAAVVASGMCVVGARRCLAQGGDQSGAPAKTPSRAVAAVRYVPNRIPMRAQMYYQGVWGVDSFKVKYTESGEIIRFSWRVLDPDRAAALNDKKVEPELLDPQAGVKLVVPQLPNVGTLRQSSTPKPGMTYWMAFSNKGRPVKRGDHVDVVIGRFRAEGLVVE